MIRHVLFDLDGTLVDTWRLYVECYRRTLADHLGRPVDEAHVMALRPAAERRLLLRELADFEAGYRTFLRYYRDLHAQLCEGLYPGIPELLAGLRADGYGLGIVTGKSDAAWQVTAELIDLGTFDVVVTDDRIQDPKPHPESLLAATDILGCAPIEAVYVGDSVADAEAAHDAGLHPLAALWAKGPDERDAFLAAIRPFGAIFCETPAAVHSWLQAARGHAPSA